MSKRFNVYDAIFLAVLILMLIVSIPWHEGIKFCDSASYVQAAKRFVDSQSIGYANVFATRVGAWLPYAAYIVLFGVNDQITWVATAEFFILLCAIYFLLRNYDQYVALCAVILLAFSTLMIQESGVATGDMMVTLCVNLPVLIYWRFIKNSESQAVGKWGIIAGLCWVTAFFTKESSVFYLVLLAFFFVIAWRSKLKRDIRFWYFFGATATLMLIVAGGYFQFQTGNFLQKLNAVNEVISSHVNTASHRVPKTWVEMVYRLTFQPIVFMAYEYSMGILLMLSGVYLVSFRKLQNRFWVWYLLLPLVAWWLFPQSLHPYQPMWLTPRLWLPLMVPLALCAAHGLKMLKDHQEGLSGRVALLAGGIALILISYLFFEQGDFSSQKRTALYAALTFFLALAVYEKEGAEVKRWRIVITSLCLVLVVVLSEWNKLMEWRRVFLISLAFVFVLHESKRLFPTLRRMIVVVMVLPFFYEWYDRSMWIGNDSEFLDSKELIDTIRANDDRGTVLVNFCFLGFSQLHERGNLKFVSYERIQQDSIQAEAYLILDKRLMNDKYQVVKTDGSADFSDLSEKSYLVETNPGDLGFKVFYENGRYQIYYRE